jgi:CHAT domain-containing protein
MKKIIFYFLLFFPLVVSRAQSPCLSSLEAAQQINLIRNDTVHTTKEIITNCQALYKQFLACKTPLPDSLPARLLNLEGTYHSDNKDFKQAILKTHEAYNYLNGQSNEILGRICFNLGFYYNLTNDLAQAQFYYLKATKHKKNPADQAQCFKAAADLAYFLGDYEQGVKTAQKSIETIEASNLPYQMADAYNILGVNLNKLNQYERAQAALQKAEYYYQQWLKSSPQKEFVLAPAIQLNLGNSAAEQKKYSYAINKYLNAKNLYEQAGDYERMIRYGLHNLGDTYERSNDLNNAYSYFTEAYKRINVTFPIVKNNEFAYTINCLAKLYVRKKRYEDALTYFKKALARFPDFESFEAKNINRIPYKSTLQLILSDYAFALIKIGKEIHQPNCYVEALKVFRYADQLIDFMRYEHAGEGSKLFWRQKTRGMYERAIEASYLAGNTEAAFRFFEKSKAVLLADKLNELGANQQLPEADAKHQRTLRDSIANLQNQLASLPANEKKRQALQTRLERFNDDFETFRKNLEKTNPAYYHYKYDNSTPGIADFQKSLSGEGFISYFVGDSAVYAFTLTAQQSRLVKLKITPQVYQSTANEFLTLCANRAVLNAQYPRYQALAYALYEQLWKPLNITSKRVIISSDGVFLPFEALVSTPSGNEFLLKRHAISYTYSANFLVKGRDSYLASFGWGNNITSRSFVGFAPEAFVPSLKQAPLNGSSIALVEVSQGFWFGKNLTQVEATKANFLRYAPNARVIQLFTHAYADSTDVGEPKVYFQDAALRLSELNQAERFDAQLLVLSACKTGIGQNQRGEGVFSLARGFAALGIPSTITTLWNVEDQPTYELTKLFYNYLEEGLPKDEALQRAKLDWLAQGGAADALPSQWAGMILVGDTAPLRSLPLAVYGLGLLGLALLGGVLWWRKRLFPPSTTKMSRF